MWYDCQWDNSPQETIKTHKLRTIGHSTVFNNEQSPYPIVSYKRRRNDYVKQFRTGKLTTQLMYKKSTKKQIKEKQLKEKQICNI